MSNLKKVNTAEQLELWLEDNNWLHDAYVKDIYPKSIGDTVPDKVSFNIGYQVNGTYEAGTPKTDKQFTITASGINLWTFNNDTSYNPEHCVSGIEVIEDDNGFGLEFDVPGIVKLLCDEMTISGPQLIEGITKPWISQTNIHVELNFLPKPKDWIDWLDAKGISAAWRYGYGEARPPEKLPYPDYSGWFLQEILKIESTNFGILFEITNKKAEKGLITIRDYDTTTESLWLAIQSIIAKQDSAIIHSGNCTFNRFEWSEFLNNGLLPDRYNL